MYNYDFSPILSRLKAVKKQSGMTNEELAAASGVPVGTLRKILSGSTTEPKLPAFIAIASALNTSVDYLVYGVYRSSAQELTHDEEQLIKNYRNSAPEVKEDAAYLLKRSADRSLEETG